MRSSDGRGRGAQRPTERINQPEKAGARSARACNLAKPTLVLIPVYVFFTAAPFCT
jgi:hypothetical protein